MVGEEILIARKKKGWTQQKLSDATGIAQTVIARYENGATIPIAKNLKLLSEHLGVTLNPYPDQISSNSNVFSEIEFEKKVKQIRRLPLKRKMVINDFLTIILDLQSIQSTAEKIK